MVTIAFWSNMLYVDFGSEFWFAKHVCAHRSTTPYIYMCRHDVCRCRYRLERSISYLNIERVMLKNCEGRKAKDLDRTRKHEARCCEIEKGLCTENAVKSNKTTG